MNWSELSFKNKKHLVYVKNILVFLLINQNLFKKVIFDMIEKLVIFSKEQWEK